MSNSQTLYYVDGTFKYCTKFFHQLFSIHAYRNGVFVPVLQIPSSIQALCHLRLPHIKFIRHTQIFLLLNHFYLLYYLLFLCYYTSEPLI